MAAGSRLKDEADRHAVTCQQNESRGKPGVGEDHNSSKSRLLSAREYTC
jgi:hypothetical protein